MGSKRSRRYDQLDSEELYSGSYHSRNRSIPSDDDEAREPLSPPEAEADSAATEGSFVNATTDPGADATTTTTILDSNGGGLPMYHTPELLGTAGFQTEKGLLRRRKFGDTLGLNGHNGHTDAQQSSSSNKMQPDSHDYEPDESEVWRAYEAARHRLDRGFWWNMNKRRTLKRWLVTLVTGVLTGLTAILVTTGTGALTDWKFRVVTRRMTEAGKPNAKALFTLMGFNLLYVLIAALTVFIEPLAAGSGIPEIKCFLNGIAIPRVVKIKTLICKVTGIMFSVASGLPAGKEGPMVHSGSVIATFCSQGQTSLLGMDTSFSKFEDFRNDREKRDFVASGAAAGVAAAFGAPIGGVLFSLEEGASFWSTKLTWRAFFCAMMTVFTLYVVKSSENFWGQQDLAKMFSFGEFGELHVGQGSYSIYELAIFIVLGLLGGLIGATFNHFNTELTLWRQKHVHPSFARRAIEAAVVACSMSAVTFCIPLLWGKCTPKPVDMEDWTLQEKTLVDELVSFNCNAHTEYNEVASLFFTDADTAIRQLFHFREGGQRAVSTFSSGALIVFFVPYAIMACITYGVSVPSGLFVPSLLSGAAFGRLCGHLLHKLDWTDGTAGTFADSGTYALIGAAAALGGMARMTISLTVILLEATGDMQYVLPLMLTLMAARWMGNVFNEGLYDIHIHLRKLPFLEDELSMEAVKNDMTASQSMSRSVKCLRPVEKVGYVYDLLNQTEHDCFPIVDTDSGGVLVGTILRKCLTVLLQHHAYGSPDLKTSTHRGSDYSHKRSHASGTESVPIVDWKALESIYPRYPSIKSVRVDECDRTCWIDLRPYVNTAPYVINESASMTRTYRLFRTLGLRHLCVVNHHNQVVGIITRKDLEPPHLKDRLHIPRTRVWASRLRQLSDDDESDVDTNGQYQQRSHVGTPTSAAGKSEHRNGNGASSIEMEAFSQSPS